MCKELQILADSFVANFECFVFCYWFSLFIEIV